MLPWIAQLAELNPFVAYELDAAVATFGLVIKNALQEQVTTGEGTNRRSRARYKLMELLDDNFQFRSENGLGVFKRLDGYSEVK